MMQGSRFETVRSRLAYALVCVAAVACNSAFAQVAAPFVGTWKTHWQSDQKPYSAVMKVTETGGTWQTFTKDKNNPCAGREVPMKVDSATPTEVKFTLQFSEAIPGCTNTTVKLNAAPDGTVTGMRSKFELGLVKQ